MQSRCAEVLLLDPDLANKNNVEATLWKSAFYTVIEALRRQAMEQNDTKIRDIQINLLTEVRFHMNVEMKFGDQQFVI